MKSSELFTFLFNRIYSKSKEFVPSECNFRWGAGDGDGGGVAVQLTKQEVTKDNLLIRDEKATKLIIPLIR